MRKLLLFSLFLVTIQIHSQTADEQKLKDLIQQSFDNIFSKMDKDMIANYYTEDYILLEQGEVWDIEKLKSYLSPDNLQGMLRVNEFNFIEVNVIGDIAWLAYHNEATFLKDDQQVGELKWLESAMAIRTENGWRLKMLHSTRIPGETE